MEYVYNYFMKNFFLLCLTFGVIFMVLRNYRSRKVAVLMPILIVSTTVLISIIYQIELFAADNPSLLYLATFCYFLGFALRPVLLYFFMKLIISKPLVLKIFLGLVILNAVVYATSLFTFWEDFSHIVLWYRVDGDHLTPERGPLYYFSYIVVGLMMAYFIFVSIRSLKGQHRYDAVASLVCVVFIAAAVVLETALLADSLLNTTIAISCLFYIVHLYQQASQRDSLTHLFDRKTFYADEERMRNRVTGLILADMNLLKHINDTFGHEAGDQAIITIANILEKCADSKKMYTYRLGGDEFLILSCSNETNVLEEVCKSIREETSKTSYSVSLGYSTQDPSNPLPISKVFRAAENMMYADKAEFYRSSGVERRKV